MGNRKFDPIGVFHRQKDIKMKSCKHIQKKLSAYQDGELKPAEHQAIETHLRHVRGIGHS